MQSFKYSLPIEKPRRRRPPILRWLLACALVGGLTTAAKPAATWAQTASARWVSWMIGDPARANERAQEAAAILRQGDQHLGKAEYDTAFKCYANALRQHPENLTAWDRARLVTFLTRENRSVSLETILPKAGLRARHWVALAERERAAGRLNSAASLFKQALGALPESVPAHLGLARVLADQGQLESAVEHAQKAILLQPEDLEPPVLLLELRLRRGDTEIACREAVVTFRSHLNTDRGPEALARLAEAYLHQGLSLSDVQIQLAKDAPSLPPTARRLGLMQAYVRHYQRNPNWHRDSFERAKELAAQTRQAGSQASQEERHRAGQLLLDAHRARAQRLLDRSDVAAARQQIEYALALHNSLPKDPRRGAELHAERARLLVVMNRPAQATQALEAAIKLVPSHASRLELARMQANMGITLLSARHMDAAREHFKRAIVLNPADDTFLARYFQALGGIPPLRAALQCARLLKEPDVGEVLTRLVRGLAETGRPKDAGALVRLASHYKVGPGYMAELRAEAALAARKMPEARAALLQAVEHRPTERLWLRLAAVEQGLASVPGTSASQRREHLASALEATRHALSQAPEGLALSQAIQLSQQLAQNYVKAQDARAAEAVAAKAMLLSPHHPELALILADARHTLKRSDGVVAACREGLAGVTDWASPPHAALRWRLGRELRLLGRHPEALEELAAGLTEAAGAPKPLAAQMWYELAFVHAALAQREEALNALRQYAVLAFLDPNRTTRAQAVDTLESKLAKAR